MSTRPRSLLNNSLGSIVSSGLLIFSTVLIPAVLARALTRYQYDIYSIVLASLPLILILPQSMRTVGASQLALAVVRHGADRAIGSFDRFVAIVAAIHVALALVGIEIYVRVDHAIIDPTTMRIGLYALLAYTLGMIAAGLAIAPAAAQRDFLPDNIAKSWPGLTQLIGVAAVWASQSTRPLLWIFAIYPISSWSIAMFFLIRSRRGVAEFHRTRTERAPPELVRDLLLGLRGVLWWNVTAYLATTATVMVVAIGYSHHIVPFSIATSLMGIVSAAMVAVSGPIAVHATSLLEQAEALRRRFFLLVNVFFQGYILVTAFVIVIAPTALYALWLTPQLAHEVKSFSLLLLPATVLRLLTMCFTVFVMSAGRQHTLWFSPMVEAGLSILGSITLGHFLGVEGIPVALAISAAVRLILTIVHDERINAQALGIKRGDVLLSGWRLARGRAC